MHGLFVPGKAASLLWYDSRVVNYDPKLFYKIGHWSLRMTLANNNLQIILLIIQLTNLIMDLGSQVVTSGQSYEHFTLVNYDSRGAVTKKLHILRL